MRLLILLCSFLGLTFQLSANSAKEFSMIEGQQLEIIYENINIKPSQIFFCENEIFVLLEQGLTRVDSLKTDSGGLFARRGYWVCPRCGGRNELGTIDCAHCPYTLPH